MAQKYNQTTFIGSHNSYCNNDSDHPDYNIKYKDQVLNQHYNIKKQFKAGVRVFDIEVQKCPFINNLIICHGPPLISWLLGESSLTNLLKEIKKLVEDNPTEIITILINSIYQVDQYDWYNTVIIQHFIDADLDKYVYDYNDKRKPDDDWPTLNDMINSSKNVMVLGLKRKQDFKKYINYFKKDSGKYEPGWNAKSLDQLNTDKLHINYQHGNCLFFMYCMYSERDNWTYCWGGNPDNAKKANSNSIALSLAQKCNEKLKDYNQQVNCIWYDFVDQETDNIIKTVKTLNDK